MSASPRAWVFAACAALAGGCAVGPDYVRPATAAQGAFRGAPEDARSVADLPWWELFKDPALQALLRQGLAASPTLEIAAARVEQARALARGDAWALLPGVDGQLSVGRQHGLTITPTLQTFNGFNAVANVSWELDVWGRLRRAREASYQVLVAQEEARRGAQVMLVADVAFAYFQLRALDAQVLIGEQREAARARSLELFEARLQGGTGNRAEVAAARAQVFDARAQVAELRRRQVQTENQLSVLVGMAPRALTRGLALEAQVMPPAVPAGLPAALLERRPDIAAAEAQLRAENARVGVAKASFFPQVSLTAALGTLSSELAGLIAPGNPQWSYGGTVSWLTPLFGHFAIQAQYQAERARYRELLADYQLTVLTALREVADALVALQSLGVQVAALEEQVKAVEEQLSLAESRYRSGVASFLEVTTAEDSALPAQLALENARAARLAAVVALYRALGGGWQAEAPAR